MAAKKKGTVEKVGDAVKGAASVVARAADENVVKPVGKALGLTGGKAGAAKKTAAKKPAAKKPAAAKKGAAKPAAKKPAAKGAKKGT